MLLNLTIAERLGCLNAARLDGMKHGHLVGTRYAFLSGGARLNRHLDASAISMCYKPVIFFFPNRSTADQHPLNSRSPLWELTPQCFSVSSSSISFFR